MSYDMHSRPGISWLAAFFILIGLLGAGLIIGSLAGAVLFSAMTGKGLMSLEKEMLNPENVQAVRILQLVSTFFIFFLPAFFTALIVNKKPVKFLGFNFYFSGRQVLLVVAIMLASLPLVGALSEINKLIPIPAAWEKAFKSLEDTYSQQVLLLSKITGFRDYIVSIVVMALGPAIFEETFFRGGMQNILQKWTKSPWLSIIITSLIFSAIHFSWYGFIPRVALGMVLGLLFWYSGSLWIAIIAHFFNNALIVTNIYYLTLQGKSIEEAMKETSPIWMGVIALVAVVALFHVYRKLAAKERRDKMPPEDIALEEKWIT